MPIAVAVPGLDGEPSKDILDSNNFPELPTQRVGWHELRTKQDGGPKCVGRLRGGHPMLATFLGRRVK